MNNPATDKPPTSTCPSSSPSTPAATNKPSILLVPGAFHTPAHYARLATALHTTHAYPTTTTIPLPSNGYSPTEAEAEAGPDPDPGAVYARDVAAIRNAIEAQIAQGRDVLVVAHSYGGIPATEAVCGFGKGEGEGKGEGNGKGKGVVGLVYMCAFMLDAGQSIATVPVAMRRVGRADEQDASIVHAKNPREDFYNDLSDSEAREAIAMLQPVAAFHVFASPGRVGWRDAGVPVGYVFCEKDQAIPPEAQRWMAGQARAQGVRVEEAVLDVGHSPFWNMAGETAAVIDGFGFV